MLGDENHFRVSKFHGKRGEDYALWKMRMKAVFIGKDVWSEIDPLQQPTETCESEKLDDFIHVNRTGSGIGNYSIYIYILLPFNAKLRETRPDSLWPT